MFVEDNNNFLHKGYFFVSRSYTTKHGELDIHFYKMEKNTKAFENISLYVKVIVAMNNEHEDLDQFSYL